MKNWKQIYENMFFNTPKNQRTTKEQILNIRSQAKIYATIYGC